MIRDLQTTATMRTSSATGALIAADPDIARRNLVSMSSDTIQGVMNPECVFCDILGGRSDARWVAREDAAVAFFPLPQSVLAPGHTLVVSRAHVVGVQDASENDLASTIALVGRVSRAMTAALGATGVNVLNASGAGSEQSVPHLHFHVVPRWEGDGFTTWPAARSNKAVDVSLPESLASALGGG